MSSSKDRVHVGSYLSLRSVRGQLLAFSVGLFGFTLLLFSAFVYQVFTSSHAREFDADLLNYTLDVGYALDVDLFGQISLSHKFASQNEKLFPFELGETLIQVRARDGSILAHSSRLKGAILPLSRDSLSVLQSEQPEFRTISAKDAGAMGLHAEDYRLLNYYFEKAPGDALILQVAAPTRVLDRERHALLTFFAVSIPLVLLIGIMGGVALSRRALAPVTAIIDKTRKLSAQRLSDRLPVPHTRDEIHELALTLNGLLDRLEESFVSQQSFVSDASHQLKTPLAILRGEIDLMLSRARSAEEIHQFLKSASEEVGYLSRVTEDLLTLARIDTGSRALQLSEVHIDEILVEAIARLQKIAATRDVDLAIHLSEADAESYCVQGDSDLLRSLFEGIIENAIKYSPQGGGKVRVNLGNSFETPDSVEITIEDQGVGITKEDLPKIFDRFYRAERAKTEQPGSGLGLTIAKRIIEVHQATIHAESEPGQGTTIRVTLRRHLAPTVV
jgi:signal transduction histidine kinase